MADIEKVSKVVNLRVTEHEDFQIRAAARSAGLTVSNYLRRLTFDYQLALHPIHATLATLMSMAARLENGPVDRQSEVDELRSLIETVSMLCSHEIIK